MNSTEAQHLDNEYIAFLVNFFEPMLRPPIEVLPGIVLRRATSAEQATFRPYDEAAHLGRNDTLVTRTTVSFNTDGVKTESNDDFRGYVLQFGLRQWATYGNNPHSVYEQLELACSVAESGLRPVLVCEKGSDLQPLFFTHNLHRHTVLRRRALGKFLRGIPKLTLRDLEEIRDLVSLIEKLPPSDRFVFEAIDRFNHVELISTDSDFHTFGLFTIIEYMLTHLPTMKDKSDSLTKQIYAKCPALGRDFDNPISPATFFRPMTDEKAWKILYGYRSAIAHGSRIDFTKLSGKKGYEELIDRANVEAFLHTFTRRLLKYALREPKRVKALKET